MKTIEYFVTPTSPWCYLGHARLVALAKKHQATIELLPFELGAKIFPQTGGLPLLQRAPARQAYRLEELARWASLLQVPMNVSPQYFPVSDALCLQALAAAQEFAPPAAVISFTESLMRAVWVEQKNVADPNVIDSLAAAVEIDPALLTANASHARARLNTHNDRAMQANVFGAPWFRYQGHNFWGQDRLDFLERALG